MLKDTQVAKVLTEQHLTMNIRDYHYILRKATNLWQGYVEFFILFQVLQFFFQVFTPAQDTNIVIFTNLSTLISLPLNCMSTIT